MQNKMSRIISALVAIVSFIAVIYFMGPTSYGNLSITMNEKEYTMCKLSLREFLIDGYSLTVTITEGKQVRFYNYIGVKLEAKTEYSMAVPLRVKEAEGSQIGAWLYNPKSKPVEVRDGMIRGISCDIADLKQKGVTVAISGLTIDTQSKEEIAAWAEQELKGFELYESEDVNALSYKKGRGSYTFNFDDDDIVTKAIVLQNV